MPAPPETLLYLRKHPLDPIHRPIIPAEVGRYASRGINPTHLASKLSTLNRLHPYRTMVNELLVLHREVNLSQYYSELYGSPHYVATRRYVCSCFLCGAVVAIPYRLLLKPAHLAPYSCGCRPMPASRRAELQSAYTPSRATLSKRKRIAANLKQKRKEARRSLSPYQRKKARSRALPPPPHDYTNKQYGWVVFRRYLKRTQTWEAQCRLASPDCLQSLALPLDPTHPRTDLAHQVTTGRILACAGCRPQDWDPSHPNASSAGKVTALDLERAREWAANRPPAPRQRTRNG